MRLFRPHRQPKGLEPKTCPKAINAIVANTDSKAPSGTVEDTTAPIRAKIATLGSYVSHQSPRHVSRGAVPHNPRDGAPAPESW